MASLASIALLACGGVVTTSDPDGGADPAPDGGADDPDPDAAAPGVPNIMFVTSTTTTGDMGGLAGADAICAARATAAGLPGTYVAWLSTTTVDAIDRLAGARGWVRPDGKPIADTAADLAAGRLFYPPRLDEHGNDVGSWFSVRTSTTIDGVLSVDPDTCGDWTTTVSNGNVTTSGLADASSYMFTNAASTRCQEAWPLYCLGVDGSAAVAPAPEAGRVAFVSNAAWLPGGGLGSADARCQSDAAASGLGGTYKALLATVGATAASRFNTAGARWVRVDGVPLTDTAAELFTTDLLHAALNVTADGQQYLGNYLVWSGAFPATAGTLASTCQDWSSSASTVGGHAGITGLTTATATYGNGNTPCNAGYGRIICLQE